MDWVAVPGPPSVRATTWSNTPREFLKLNTTLIVKNGMMSGKVIFQNCFHLFAPSSEAAS